jgi:hypothetical protein
MDTQISDRSRRERRIAVRSVLATLFVVALLHIAGMIAYAVRVRASAQALIQSAREIHSVADADRLASTWGESSFRGHTAFHSRERHEYQFEVRSGLLTTFHLVPSTGILLQVTLVPDQRQRVVLGMYTDQSSVWVQDDSTAANSSVQSQPDPSGSPKKAVVILGAGADESTRARAFAFNPNCLAKLGGCSDAQQILSTVRQLENIIHSPVADMH